MTNDLKYLWILKIARNRLNLNGLLKAGLSFKDIAELTEMAKKDGLLVMNEDQYQLTQAGEKKFQELFEMYKLRNKEQWISKEIISQIPKIDPEDIYIPDQSRLFF